MQLQSVLCRFSLRPVISDGSLEALKWLALLAMTLDHVNKVIFSTNYPLMTDIGRLAMPIFGFVLAYNLARERAFSRKMHLHAIKRMGTIGIIATPFYILTLGKGGWYPVNIMFTLMLVTVIVFMIEKGGRYREISVMLLFAYGAMLVDYAWFGVIYCLAAWYFCRECSFTSLIVWIAATAGLFYVNGNFLAILAIPLIYLSTRVNIGIPRLRSAFYVYYPAHLMLLWGLTYWLL